MISLIRDRMTRDKISMRRRLTALICAAFCGATLLSPALAEVSVTGNQASLVMSVQDATIEEVLASLSNTFDLQYRMAGAASKRLTGEFKGSLPRVLGSVLEGSDYVLKHTAGGGMNVIVFGSRDGPGPVAAPPPPPRTAARPRTAPPPAVQPITPPPLQPHETTATDPSAQRAVQPNRSRRNPESPGG